MNTFISQNVRDLANEFYCKARDNFSKETPLTFLHIGDEYIIASCGYDAAQPEQIWEFPIGSEITARACFKHELPASSEIEEAIMMIEDEIMPVHKLLIPNSKLITFDAVIGQIASQTEISNHFSEQILTIGNMESVFNRMAAIVMGRPASMDTLPMNSSFIVSLLILREFMHHLGFKEITIVNKGLNLPE